MASARSAVPVAAIAAAWLMVCAAAPVQGEEAMFTPTQLRCEYLVAPQGIDALQPRLSWVLTPRDDAARGLVQTAYQVLVADAPETLAKDTGNLWDSGQVAGNQTNQITYAGQPLHARQVVYWKVRAWDGAGQLSAWSTPASWSMGLLQPADWGDAKWIGDATPAPEGYDPLPAPVLRKTFTSDAPAVKRATAHVTALGVYELWLNGQRVGDHLLAPEWTDYRQRVQYQTYDVTKQVQSGDNTLAALIGDGWYAGKIGLTMIVPGGPPRAIYGRQPALLLRLDIERSDGTTQTIVSDGTWESTLAGPVRVGDLLDGEAYDAQRTAPGADPTRVADGWQAVAVRRAPTAKLVAQPNEPIRVTSELTPVAITTPKPDVHIFDLGQNMVGWCRLTTQGPAGTTVTLRHGEMLNPDGTLYTTNLRGAAQRDRYTLRGAGTEVFEPHFTYHGFRYVEVTGLAEQPTKATLLGRAFHSAAPDVGTFECSAPLLNKLWQNIFWTQRDNMHSTPTDCPQRDERCGWMGDILAFAPTACSNMDMAAFYTKWLHDTRDAQATDGRFADFSPQPYDPNVRFSGVPAWGDAGVFVPWVAYLYYGDERALAEQFDAAVRWIEYIHGKNPDLLWKQGRGNDYGDWLNADTLKLEGWPTKGAEMPKEVFATAFFARSTQIVADMARVLGKGEAAQKYAQLAGDIRKAFNAAYVQADGQITGDTQAGYALALQFGLLPEKLQPAAAQRMVGCFERYDGQISTGFHSTAPLMLQLSARGQNDAAYRLVQNRKMPSWGYAIDQGATTIWERWDGYVAGRGFQDPGMNSFAHYALGSVGQWFYEVVLGICPDPNAPGFAHFVIHPRPGPGLTWAKGGYASIRGPIASEWRLDGKDLTLTIEVPANTTATVHVPAVDAERVTESGKPAREAAGVKYVRYDDGAAVYDVGSGRYVFKAELP